MDWRPPASRQPFPPVWREWLVLAALLCAFTAIGVHERWFWRIDTMLYDAGLSLWERPAPADIVLVAIDEPSLARIGRWPWSRTRLAEAIGVIAADHPRAILLDVILAEPQSGDGGGADLALAAALQQAGNVVLPVYFAGNGTELAPLPAFQAAARLGHAQLELDPDGIARTVYLREGLGRPDRPHVSVAMLEAAAGGPRTPMAVAVSVAAASAAAAGSSTAASGPAADRTWRRADWRFIPFAGPPGHFRQVSIASVLEGGVPRGTFERAHVLLGATATGLGDANPTPTSGFSRPMPGIEVNANVLAAVRDGGMILPVATELVAAASVTVLGALLAAYLFLSSRGALAATALAFATVLGCALLALRAGSVWLPPATLLAAILLAHALWSWRRLEAAQRFLDLQLHELGGGRDAPDGGQERVRGDPLWRRIAHVRAAQARLAQVARERDELMRFLSRDMRTPQVAILEELAMRRQHAAPGLSPMDDAHFESIERLAGKSLALADEFVQLTRTGLRDPVDLVPVDLAGVVDSAVDDVLPMARYKRVFIERASAPRAWVRGEPHMLFGAVCNLLHNAVRLTPADTVVTIAVERQGGCWVCMVTDQGPGIPDDVRQALLEADALRPAAPAGMGFLGIELVKAVARRHRGELSIRSSPGQGATFRLALPAEDTPAGLPSSPGNGETQPRRL